MKKIFLALIICVAQSVSCYAYTTIYCPNHLVCDKTIYGKTECWYAGSQNNNNWKIIQPNEEGNYYFVDVSTNSYSNIGEGKTICSYKDFSSNHFALIESITNNIWSDFNSGVWISERNGQKRCVMGECRMFLNSK